MSQSNVEEHSLQQIPTTKQDAKKAKKAAKHPPAPAPKLFEQVSHDMVEKLVHDMQIPHDSPTLLDRLRALGLINVQSSATNTPASSQPSSKNPSVAGFKNTFFDQLSLNQTAARSTNSQTNEPASTSRINAKSKATGYTNIFTLGDFAAVDAISMLTDSYGRVSHMGILDGSYSFFVSSSLDAALCFKVKDHVCLVGGDPLCPDELVPELLDQFAKFRRKHDWGIIFIGASDTFTQYARSQKWTTIQFGNERVLNPVTNPILQKKAQKRIISQNRQLLNPSKGGIALGIYNPSVLKDPELQAKLVAVYDAWREARNNNGQPQAFITVFDPFAITGLMTYVYTMDRLGQPNGFAALRRIGKNNGFHLDPYIAHPSAPRGISDLLIFSSLSLLNAAGCTYLSLGYEPLTESGEISGMPRWIQRLTRKTHKVVYGGLNVSGKKGFYDKWCPDEEQRTGLHLVFPAGTPGVQDIVAVMHFANIRVRKLFWGRLRGFVSVKEKVEGLGSKERMVKSLGNGDIEVDVPVENSVEPVPTLKVTGPKKKKAPKAKQKEEPRKKDLEHLSETGVTADFSDPEINDTVLDTAARQADTEQVTSESTVSKNRDQQRLQTEVAQVKIHAEIHKLQAKVINIETELNSNPDSSTRRAENTLGGQTIMAY